MDDAVAGPASRRLDEYASTTSPSFAPVRALSIFVGSWISRHFLNPLILGFIETPMTVRLYKIPSLKCLIGRECHDHQDDKNRNDQGWNKPGSHCAFPSLSCGVSWRFCALQRPARRFASVNCEGVNRVATRSYPDRA